MSCLQKLLRLFARGCDNLFKRLENLNEIFCHGLPYILEMKGEIPLFISSHIPLVIHLIHEKSDSIDQFLLQFIVRGQFIHVFFREVKDKIMKVEENVFNREYCKHSPLYHVLLSVAIVFS